MQTILRGKNKEVTIEPHGTFVIIGEKINPTGRKKLAAALQEGNLEYVKEIAANQVAAGADLLDVNVGVPGLDDVAMLPKVVQMLAENFDLPLCLDTPNALAIHAGVTCAITDPMKYGLFIKATDLLLGRDNYAARYIKYFKAHPKEEPKKPA